MRKTLRYFYWLVIEFIKKNQKILLLAFLSSFVLITFFSSTKLPKFFGLNKQVIGMVGRYTLTNPPEEIANLVSNPLFYIDEKGYYQPVLVSSWENLGNYQKFRVVLRNNLFWNDGKKLSTRDIDLKLKGVKIEKPDERTLIFILEKPSPIFLSYLTKPILRNGLIGVAGSYHPTRIKLKNGFISEIYLNPRLETLPPLVYIFFENEEKMIFAYKKGEITKMVIRKKNIADNFLNWKNTKVTKLVDYNHPVTIFFNLKDNRLTNREIRTALSKAINKALFKDYGEIAFGPIPPNSIFFSKVSSFEIYSPELALNLIKSQSTATNSAQFKFKFITTYDFLDFLDILKQQFNAVGADIEVKIINRVPTEDFSMFLTYWTVPSLENQYFFWHSSQNESNISSYNNAKIDKILEEIRATTNPTLKKKLADDFQKIFAEDPPAIFLFYPFKYLVERK